MKCKIIWNEFLQNLQRAPFFFLGFLDIFTEKLE